ncbi:MAG: glycoside hydrolase family 76 protein [Ferruginibacter sp.]|nr:glycoside hydrolase family 76 protein [Ferruginibacter sp.]
MIDTQKNRRSNLVLGALFLVTCFLSACLKSKDEPVTPPAPVDPGAGVYVYKWAEIADSAQNSLNFFWRPADKTYTATNASSAWVNYWPSAHALDVLIDLYERKPGAAIKTRMDDLIAGVKAKNGNTYINYYYDDMEWMALAALRAFKVTNDVQYKELAQLLWADIKNGWSSDLGGGIWWRKDNPSKNAPSNLPAAILAARLYKTFNNPDDLVWAKKIYDWQKEVLYDANSGWVYDNIEANGTKNTSWKFTYNQGTFVGAALELYSITNQASYLADAIKGADYTLLSGQLTDVSNGILKNEGGGDGGLFKGVFIRYFTRLIIDGGIDNTKKTQYIQFLKTNAQKLWNSGTNKSQVLFGSAWNTAPGASTDLTTQLSGIMLFEALAELKKLNLVD